MELCACKFNLEVIKVKQVMRRPDDNMILMMTTPEDVTSFKVNLMTTTYKDKKVLNLAQVFKDEQYR